MTRAHWHRNIALVLPLLLVNSAAVYGQAGWAHDHLGGGWVIAALFALAVESIGVFLAAEAHAALMAGHASGSLRLGSYLVGALVGVLNFAHLATQPGYQPNPLAVTFGLLSSISPWLWAIRSRSMNRVRLYELGLIDPRAVKFSRLRWMLYPVRTFGAFRSAVWAGIQRPEDAVAAADAGRAHRRTAKAPHSVGVVETLTVQASTPARGHDVPQLPAAEVSAQLPPELPAEVAPELPPAAAAKPPTRRGGTSPRKSTAKKRTRKGATSPRRPVAETRKLAADLRTRFPEINNTELARQLGISPTRLRQVEKTVNGTENAELIPTT